MRGKESACRKNGRCEACKYKWAYRNRHNRRVRRKKMYWRAYRLDKWLKRMKRKLCRKAETGEILEDLKTAAVVVMAFVVMLFVTRDMIQLGIW